MTRWEFLAVAYCFFVLCLVPVSSARVRGVEFLMVVGAAGLLVSGFVRLMP
jgi:FPC/CPF motif-containing protein YcgG